MGMWWPIAILRLGADFRKGLSSGYGLTDRKGRQTIQGEVAVQGVKFEVGCGLVVQNNGGTIVSIACVIVQAVYGSLKWGIKGGFRGSPEVQSEMDGAPFGTFIT